MLKSDRRANRLLLILMIGMMAAVAVGVVAMWYIVSSGPRVPLYAEAASSESSPPGVGGPFTLIDQTGKTVTNKTFDGFYRLMYFGYSFCPDVCPTELQVMSQAIETLGEDGKKIWPIFITVDPVRDTPEHLATYVKQFDPRLTGLTGTQQQVAMIARAFKVYYARAERAGDPVNYGMDHSSFVYLMAPDGIFLTVFPPEMDADKMADEIRKKIKGN